MKDGLCRVVRIAQRVKAQGGEVRSPFLRSFRGYGTHQDRQLPIAAFVTRSQWSSTSSDSDDVPKILPPPQNWSDHDTRNTLHHPLRHACMNIIRQVAGTQADLPTPSAPTLTPSYLLTSYTLFLTHEPCIMCTMALLHSRVKDVFYVFPMPQTGGCGGLVKESVPGLRGVNHRFGIFRWKEELLAELGVQGTGTELSVDPTLDV